jgi:hypothetical protein
MIKFQVKRLPRLAKFYRRNEIIRLLCSEEIYNFVVENSFIPQEINSAPSVRGLVGYDKHHKGFVIVRNYI